MTAQNTYSLNREDCLKILESDSAEFKDKLLCARIFFKDSLTDAVETVAIYSTSGYEVKTWIDNKIKFYKKHNIPFAAYVNYCFEDSEGDLFNAKEVK